MIAHDRSSIWVGLADLLLCVLSVVIVAVAPKSPAQSGVEMKALYLLTIEWDVGIDADADIHLMPPRGKPVFYASREVGCATLDRDNRGFLDSIVELLDGSKTKVMTNKETIAIRCVEPGRYDLAANLYAYRADNFNQTDERFLALKVHAEIIGLNPAVKLLFARDVTLDRIGQTENVASFDMAQDGTIAFVDPPLAPITDNYQKRPGQ